VPFVPPIFVSHGEPTLALDREERGADLVQWARALTRPRAILVVSAHWQEPTLTRGTTHARPSLVIDTADPAVRGVRYPAPGAPELAYELSELVALERAPERGWDEGVWAPLVHMFPEADVPVLQLSLVRGASPRDLHALGRRIGVLADRGVLIMGSGAITYGAAEKAADLYAPPADWARELDAWFANQLADAETDLVLAYRRNAPHARRGHPTSEHIDPLFFVMGAASHYEHAVGFPVRGFEHGTVSRRCIQFAR
jgi:4,5-DOPA dioxygenase extradiol